MATSIIFLPLLGFLFCFLLGKQFNYRVYQISTTSILFLCTLFSWIIFTQFINNKETEIIFILNWISSGNFIVALIDKLSEYHDRQYVIDHMVYAVELMEDNHKELCGRVGVDLDHPHYVCHDALTYDYSFGEPVGVEAFF